MYIGIDESGKGDYFGYLVVAGVVADRHKKQFLRYLGVRDSKTLSGKQIFDIGGKIEKLCEHDIVRISPKKYNQLYKKMNNMNKLLAWGHARVLENLLDNVECERAISDQFGDKEFLENALMGRGKKIKLLQLVHGEKDIAVAAASILARMHFLMTLKKLSDYVGMDLPKGAAHVVNVGKTLVKRKGTEILDIVAKKHFRTTGKILNDV